MTRKWKDGNGNQQEETCFTKVEFWGALAEKVVGPYVKKGTKVAIQGRLKLNQWTDNDGKKHFEHIIVGDAVELLSKPSTSASGDQSQGSPAPRQEQGPIGSTVQREFQGEPSVPDDDILF